MNAHASEFSLTIDPGRSAFSSAVDMPESELTDIPRRLPPSMAASAASPRALAISVIAFVICSVLFAILSRVAVSSSLVGVTTPSAARNPSAAWWQSLID